MTFWEEQGAGAPTKRERPGGKVVVLVVVLLLLLAGGGYVAAYAVAGDKVPRGTTISGVDVGGLPRPAAIGKLQDAFEDRAGEPIKVRVDEDRTTEVKPDDLGLAVDYAASVDAAGAEKSLSPARQWDYFTGGDDMDAVVDVDEDLLDAKLAELSEGLGTPPKDGGVEFTEDGVDVIDPVPGDAVDPDAARAAITAAFLGEEDTAELTVETAEPDIDEADVEEALETFANPAMGSAVTLVFGKAKVRLQPKQYADALAMVAEDGRLVPKINGKRIAALVKDATTRGEPVDATVTLKKGKPRVVPAKPGVQFKRADVVSVFTDLLTAPDGERRGKVEATVRRADFTTKDARQLRIKRKISEFTTHYPHAEYRNVNLGRAAELIDGTVLKPGDVFSLNGIVGERTAENGFTQGYIISNGILVQDYGGGVSQMATTLFNAMFFAGLKDVEHKPHSFYIDRYPVGREATVAWPTLDLRFENDSEYGVLVHAYVNPSTYSGQGSVTVEMYSTKVWDIESVTSDRYNYRAPSTRTLTSPDCEPHTGWSGFDVDVTRIFRKHGEQQVDHRETFHTAYTASDSVVCKQPGDNDNGNNGNGGNG